MRFSHNRRRRGVATVGLAALVAGAAGLCLALGQAPSAALKVEGVSAPSIQRDRGGVPHVLAKTENDALFGLGYAHAQDRLWQMEYQRRLGSGRLAEVLGPSALPSDRFFRTLGTHRAAESAWANFAPDARAGVEAYVAGINAYLNSRHRRSLAPEFGILGFRPAPWRPEDTLVWMKTLAWSLGSNWEAELMRVRLAQQVGSERAAQLLPAFMAKDPLILPGGAPKSADQRSTTAGSTSAAALVPGSQADALLALGATLRKQFGMSGEQAGSNNWVIGGARTTTGKPILANDPHLPSQIPSTWYLAHVEGGALDVIGATLPGIPAVIAGHNGLTAWGITNTGTDVQDLFIEQIQGDQVVYQGALEPLIIVPETIRVKNQPDVVLNVRVTRHGPLISDVVAPGGAALAIRWAGLDAQDDTVAALMRMNRARNWSEFTAGLQRYKVAMQNIVYADRDGNIGYIAPGAIPLRAQGDGTAPVPGWTGEHEWQGYVPFDQLPQAFNPPQNYLVSANNRVASAGGYPYHVGSNFAPYYRAARIVEMIKNKPKHSPNDIAAMQADINSLHAREVLGQLLEATPLDKRSRAALALLRGWNGAMRGDSPQAAIFQAWLAQIPAALFADELGEELWGRYRGLRYLPDIATANVLNDPDSVWYDDVRTAATVENSRTLLGAALAQGLKVMAQAQGTDVLSKWRWDKVHPVVFPHRPFDTDPKLGPLFNRSIGGSGDRFTVNVGPPGVDTFEQRHVGDYRQIVDLGDMNRSRFIVAPGQSGNPDSRHYDDLLPLWQQVEYLPMRYGRAAGKGATAHEPLVLQP